MKTQLNTGPGRGRSTRRWRPGFTLTEASLTMVVVGVGMMATLQLLAAGTSCNVEATESTMAVNLGRNVRELTLRLSYDDVLAMDGTTFSPPVDSCGKAVGGFGEWSQQIDVQPVDWDRLTTETIEPSPDAVRVTVKVMHNGSLAGQVQWYRFKAGS